MTKLFTMNETEREIFKRVTDNFEMFCIANNTDKKKVLVRYQSQVDLLEIFESQKLISKDTKLNIYNRMSQVMNLHLS